MSRYSLFDRARGRLGFGFMRLPMQNGRVDEESTCAMVDAFLDGGMNVFDLAKPYLHGQCEHIFQRCVAQRYPRERYWVTDKLTPHCFQSKKEIRPLLESQLKTCGVQYLDLVLMHSQNAATYEKYRRLHAYEALSRLREEGKVRHVGISFHDTAEVLERILNDQPQIEVVQLQINYMDWDDPVTQSKQCHALCVRYGKPVIVMEPIKGGALSNLPEDAAAPIRALGHTTPADMALRFAASLPNVEMVLSGMSTLEQVQSNVACLQNVKPLNNTEERALEAVKHLLRQKHTIPCTGCRYCMDTCPMDIRIPDLFACLNAKVLFGDPNAEYYYEDVHTARHGKPSDCIGCGRCMKSCPQKLLIPRLLTQVAQAFEANPR